MVTPGIFGDVFCSPKKSLRHLLLADFPGSFIVSSIWVRFGWKYSQELDQKPGVRNPSVWGLRGESVCKVANEETVWVAKLLGRNWNSNIKCHIYPAKRHKPNHLSLPKCPF